VWIPVQREIGEVSESLPPAFRVDIPACGTPADRLRNFNIEQMGGVERQSRLEQTALQDCRRWHPKNYFHHNRSVDDDHSRSRSARIISAAPTGGVTAERLSRRARSSSMVGRSAAARISLSK